MYETISILAGGYSATHYDIQNLPGYVLGVNDACLYGKCDAYLSMDRLWTEGRWDWLCQNPKPAWIRDAAVKKIKQWPSWMTVFNCDYRSSVMSDDPTILNGTNSGLCAVNLAYQLRPSRIELYGMDLATGPKGERHFYPPYPWSPTSGTTTGKFQQWQRDLNSAIRQCRDAAIVVKVNK